MTLPQDEISVVSTPVYIDSPDGELFAICQEPQNITITNCIIMLNSGMLNRSGPQRLYWTFAREACISGIAVIRVDLAGTGDSKTEINDTHFDNHRKEDVNSVINYALKKWPDSNVILQGLCAGSRVAFKAAAKNDSVAAILAWSNEIYTASQNMPQSPHEPVDRLSEYEVNDTLQRLLKFIISFKFLKPSWWRNQYPDGKGFFDEIKHTLKCTIKAILPQSKQQSGDFLVAADNYLNSKRKVLFLFGENDERALNEFQSRFPQIKKNSKLAQAYEIISNGTHTFSTISSTKELTEKSLAWIKMHL